jgi:CheY-like chemotaxis protein
MSVLEIMPVNDAVAHKIEAGALPDELLAAARPLGMRTLWESGLERVWAGHTSIEEVVRVLGEKNEEDASGQDIVHGAVIPEAVRSEVTLDEDAKPHILVADDDPQMRRLIRSILERDGYRVTEASDGLDALESIESGQFSLMMLDIDMPRLDGLGVLEELRTRIKTAGVPVVVLTARTDDTEIRVLELGAQDFLSKPVQPQSLQARVKAVLRRAKLA